MPQIPLPTFAFLRERNTRAEARASRAVRNQVLVVEASLPQKDPVHVRSLRPKSLVRKVAVVAQKSKYVYGLVATDVTLQSLGLTRAVTSAS